MDAVDVWETRVIGHPLTTSNRGGAKAPGAEQRGGCILPSPGPTHPLSDGVELYGRHVDGDPGTTHERQPWGQDWEVAL